MKNVLRRVVAESDEGRADGFLLHSIPVTSQAKLEVTLA